jgi:hypothetical protein
MKKSDFMKLDYFVFSSHKTMTQSITHTLRGSGYICTHAHTIDNLKITDKEFLSWCLEYKDVRKEKLKIISIFRDPFDRIFSSFFQSLSVEKFGRTQEGEYFSLRDLELREIHRESVLFSENFYKVQKRFWYYIVKNNGFGESIGALLKIFGISEDQLQFNPTFQIVLNEFDDFNLYISRFDLCKENLDKILGILTEKEIEVTRKNVTSDKWYDAFYVGFRENVIVPDIFITNMYEYRRKIGEVFYHEDYPKMMQASLSRYGF